MSDQPDDGIPAELRPWVDEHRAELERVAREEPGRLDALRAQYTDELTALLAPYEPASQISVEVHADPVAILAAHTTAHVQQITLRVDDGMVTIIRAND